MTGNPIHWENIDFSSIDSVYRTQYFVVICPRWDMNYYQKPTVDYSQTELSGNLYRTSLENTEA